MACNLPNSSQTIRMVQSKGKLVWVSFSICFLVKCSRSKTKRALDLLGKEFKAVLVISRMLDSAAIPGLEHHPNCRRSQSNFCSGNETVLLESSYIWMYLPKDHF